METLLATSLVLLLVVVAVAAWWSYRRHARAAQARSRAALNRLLAEADELAQAARAESPTEPERPDEHRPGSS